MYVIVQKQDNFVVGLCEELIDNNDGSFLDVDEDILYYKGEFFYYPNVNVPAGVNVHQYTYTLDEGFKVAFSKLELMKARLASIEEKQMSDELLIKSHSLYHSFKNEKGILEDTLNLLSTEAVENSTILIDIQKACCELYELLIELQGEKNNE